MVFVLMTSSGPACHQTNMFDEACFAINKMILGQSKQSLLRYHLRLQIILVIELFFAGVENKRPFFLFKIYNQSKKCAQFENSISASCIKIYEIKIAETFLDDLTRRT